ncbi:hypothetical protein C922_02029 [Plasmodium inui San Antonio 1]|uniref:Uncharacterized protein n=1 Tax=Plasmodium inui San Antonio 1 TaxID=1237626 RepID=W7A836_9APIC|nr:hypothetical protein C922_02029 [Plasmodium inui San Antonio 1]EUD67840.1 hypothetical protein C922_02029 [Plasmodium inui San Antonio 1]
MLKELENIIVGNKVVNGPKLEVLKKIILSDELIGNRPSDQLKTFLSDLMSDNSNLKEKV